RQRRRLQRRRRLRLDPRPPHRALRQLGHHLRVEGLPQPHQRRSGLADDVQTEPEPRLAGGPRGGHRPPPEPGRRPLPHPPPTPKHAAPPARNPPAPLRSGPASGAGALTTAVAQTDGSIGYSDLATARAGGFDVTPNRSGVQDTTFWTPLQNNPAGNATGYVE